jgi:hypothetical protein
MMTIYFKAKSGKERKQYFIGFHGERKLNGSSGVEGDLRETECESNTAMKIKIAKTSYLFLPQQ